MKIIQFQVTSMPGQGDVIIGLADDGSLWIKEGPGSKGMDNRWRPYDVYQDDAALPLPGTRGDGRLKR